tara:strand:+ start:428 stop:1660 length:1233 start_codon:yes stop_codon:yes gene_type:complete
MLNERKLTERELGKREEAIKGLMSNKRKLVKKYGKDAEKVMYGIATKQAKNKVESMDKEKIRELVKQSLLKKEGFVNTTPLGEPESGQEVDVDTGFSGRADYGAEDKYLGGEDEIEQSAASTPPSGRATFLPGVPTPTEENVEIPASTMVKYNSVVKNAKTAAESILAFYDQMIEKETMDFSKNPKMRVALDRLRDLAKSEDKEDLKEGHGLGQKDLDTLESLRNQIEQGTLDSKKQDAYVKVLDFLIKSNILQDKTKDLSKGKVNETRDDEAQMMASTLIDALGTSTTLENLIYAMSTDDAKLYLSAIMRDYDIDNPMDINLDNLEEVGGYDRKGNKEMDNDDKGLKKRPQAGISALLKSAVREKLTKKSSVEDHVDDFKKSDAKQFKGKSLKKIKQMALASFLSKQND